MNAVSPAPLLLAAPHDGCGLAPFTTGTPTPWLLLRTRSGLAHALRYRDLLEAGFDGEKPHCRAASFSIVMLHFYPRKRVTLEGRNLRPLVEAILRFECHTVTECAQEPRAGAAADAAAPVVYSIHLGGFYS